METGEFELSLLQERKIEEPTKNSNSKCFIGVKVLFHRISSLRIKIFLC